MSTKRSVLVVNTDIEQLAKLKQRLPNYGLDVEGANTLESAQLQASQGSFDLLLVCFDSKTDDVRGYARELRASGIDVSMLVIQDVLRREMLSGDYFPPSPPEDFDYVYSELARNIQTNIWRHERERSGRSSTWRLGINNHLNDHIVPAEKTPQITKSDARVLQALFAGGPSDAKSTVTPADDGWKDDLRMVKTGLSNLLKRFGSVG